MKARLAISTISNSWLSGELQRPIGAKRKAVYPDFSSALGFVLF